MLKTNTWWSVAGTIPELRAVAESLGVEKSHAARELSEKIYNSIPRFEGSEEVRPASCMYQYCLDTNVDFRNGNDVTTV